MFSQRRSHYWSQQSRTFFFKGFSAKQQKKPKKAANYSVIEQNALSDNYMENIIKCSHPKMTGKTRVWPVKSAIRPDIVRWPAVISSPCFTDYTKRRANGMTSKWRYKNQNSSYRGKDQWIFGQWKWNLVRVSGEFESTELEWTKTCLKSGVKSDLVGISGELELSGFHCIGAVG